MKTAKDFADAAKKKKLTEWTFRSCSICHYPLKYLFQPNGVFFDQRCDCTGRGPNLQPSSFGHLADLYNMQDSPVYIKELNTLFGFKE